MLISSEREGNSLFGFNGIWNLISNESEGVVGLNRLVLSGRGKADFK